MSVLGPFSKERKSTRDKANISNPQVNRGCAPLTANRISANCVQFHLDPQYHIFHRGSTILGDSTLWILSQNRKLMLFHQKQPCSSFMPKPVANFYTTQNKHQVLGLWGKMVLHFNHNSFISVKHMWYIIIEKIQCFWRYIFISPTALWYQLSHPRSSLQVLEDCWVSSQPNSPTTDHNVVLDSSGLWDRRPVEQYSFICEFGN